MLCQVNEKNISKNSQGNWVLDQTTVEASYYAIIERDSLIAENNKLRDRVKDLETNNTKLINQSIALTQQLETQLLINQTATRDLNETNDEIINVWIKLYKGAHLNANAFYETSGVFYTSLYLSAPIDLEWSVSASVLYGLNIDNPKPSYFIGLSYNLF